MNVNRLLNKGKGKMKIYTIKFYKNGKKYGYRGANFKIVKKIIKKFKVKSYGYYDPEDL